MSANSIQLSDIAPHYLPGAIIRGSAKWTTEGRLSKVEFRLFWFTSGAAPRQIGLVEKKTVERPLPFDSASFEFQLPEGPWSFSGHLAELNWAVEAVLLPTRQHARAVFNVGPTSEHLYLNPPPEPSEWQD